jgi:iron(III) transport system substrate-binding protein
MRTLTRRALLRIAALGAAPLATACGRAVTPEAAPVGSALPSGTPAPPASPAFSASPTSPPPTASPTPPASPARDTIRTTEWEAVVAAATREGQLALITLANRGWTTVIERFERAFPGIAVHRLAESSAAAWRDALRRGRAGGGQSFDLAFVQPVAALAEDGPGDLWAPLRPLLVRADVLDDGAWRDGLAARFLDDAGAVCFDWEHQVHHAYLVNTELVRDGEIRSVRDLLDPKWRGNVISSDPRVGDGLMTAAAVAQRWGRDVLKQLLVDQRPTVHPNGWDQSLAEAFLRGRHPIARGLRPKPLAELRARGLAGSLAYLDLPDADFVPSTALLLADRAPHPAAAKLFANWILTREGQAVLTANLPTNSARTDVPPFEADGVGAIANAYYEPDREANQARIAATGAFVREVLRAAR